MPNWLEFVGVGLIALSGAIVGSGITIWAFYIFGWSDVNGESPRRLRKSQRPMANHVQSVRLDRPYRVGVASVHMGSQQNHPSSRSETLVGSSIDGAFRRIGRRHGN